MPKMKRNEKKKYVSKWLRDFLSKSLHSAHNLYTQKSSSRSATTKSDPKQHRSHKLGSLFDNHIVQHSTHVPNHSNSANTVLQFGWGGRRRSWGECGWEGPGSWWGECFWCIWCGSGLGQWRWEQKGPGRERGKEGKTEKVNPKKKERKRKKKKEKNKTTHRLGVLLDNQLPQLPHIQLCHRINTNKLFNDTWKICIQQIILTFTQFFCIFDPWAMCPHQQTTPLSSPSLSLPFSLPLVNNCAQPI